MKKVLFILFFATLSLGCYAQKGMQGVGLSVDGGFITSRKNYGSVVPITTLKYQYYIKDNIRLVPSLAMGVGDVGSFHVNPYIKADVFLTPISKFRVYASAGLGYAYNRQEVYCSYNYKYTYGSNNQYEGTGYDSEYYDAPPHFFSYLLGIGVEWRVAYNWTIQLSGNLAGLAGGSLEYPESYVKDGKTYHLDYTTSYSARKIGGHLSFGFVYNF